MGTVHDQPARKYRFTDASDARFYMDFVDELALQYDWPVSDVLKALEVLELGRHNSLYVDNGDVWDEQVSGLAKGLEEIALSLEKGLEALDYTLNNTAGSV